MRVPMAVVPGTQRVSADTARYLTRVHRLAVGDRFVAFDPEAKLEADGVVVAAGKRVEVALSDVRPATRVATRAVTLIQALAKGAKIDAVVRDATELGATRVIIAIAERSVKRGGDVRRWRRIAIEAARQCGRGDVPMIDEPMPLRTALDLGGGGVMLHPDASATYASLLCAEGPFAIAIGPEGGFSDAELADGALRGYPAARLGDFVLRTETACAAALGALLV
jgi:16S rRNA (uracil1498-N3)-methyltransferase